MHFFFRRLARANNSITVFFPPGRHVLSRLVSTTQHMTGRWENQGVGGAKGDFTHTSAALKDAFCDDQIWKMVYYFFTVADLWPDVCKCFSHVLFSCVRHNSKCGIGRDFFPKNNDIKYISATLQKILQLQLLNLRLFKPGGGLSHSILRLTTFGNILHPTVQNLVDRF